MNLNLSENKRQHFVTISYLRRFTNTGDESGILHSYDLLKDKEFKCSPRGVANRHKYYRLEGEYEGVHPDAADQILDRNSAFLSTIIDQIIHSKKIPPKIDVFNNIHMQIALMMARSAEMREMNELIHILALKEHIKAKKLIETAPVEVKKHFEKVGIDELEVKVKKDYLISSIFEIAAENFVWLEKRRWMVAEASPGINFVTSDQPVTLKNIDPKKRGKYGPGLRYLYSRIFFPISPKFALVGEFNEDLPDYKLLNIKEAAIMNTQVIERPYSQIYFSEPDFKWFTPDGKIGNLEDFKALRRNPEVARLYETFQTDKIKEKSAVIKSYLYDNYNLETFERKTNL